MYRGSRAREASIFSTRRAETSRELNTGAVWTEHAVCRHGAHTRVEATALGSYSNDWRVLKPAWSEDDSSEAVMGPSHRFVSGPDGAGLEEPPMITILRLSVRI